MNFDLDIYVVDIEQSTLIWIARIVFFAIAVAIALGVWRFMRRERAVVVPGPVPYTPPKHLSLPEKTIVLAVMAKPGRIFDMLRVFKVLHELGFKYSEQRLFDYYAPDSEQLVFSVANHRKPYQFKKNPQEMPPTNGLMAVMQLPIGDGDQQTKYFHLLLSILDELRTNLDAQLCSASRQPLQNSQLYQLQKDIETFEQNYATMIQNDYQR